jgi:ABC-2 type transport system permease protein
MKKYLKNFSKYRHLLYYLVIRDIKVKYRRSILGLLWSILNPILMMLVITAVFSTLFRFDIQNYPVYYLTGSLVFNFISEGTNNAMSSVIQASSLIKKAYIPKYIFPVQKNLFAFVNLLFSMVALAVIVAISKIKLTVAILLAPYALICALIFSIGVGLILSAIAVYFRDVIHLYSVVITAIMYFTPIFYPANIIPKNLQIVLKLNPNYYFIDYFRQVVMYGKVPSLYTHIVCLLVAVFSLIIGIAVFKKLQERFILYI